MTLTTCIEPMVMRRPCVLGMHHRAEMSPRQQRIQRSHSLDATWQAAWAVLTKDEGSFVGMVNYHARQPWNRRLAVGWILVPESWGRGYMHEAMQVLIAHCFEALARTASKRRLSPRTCAQSGWPIGSDFSGRVSFVTGPLSPASRVLSGCTPCSALTGIVSRHNSNRTSYRATISRVALIGSFSTLHSADRFASRGRTVGLPEIDAHRADANLVGDLKTDRPRLIRASRR